MLNSIDAEAYNPILSYKLDPGEMGVGSPSTAMLSVEHVAGHETGNVGRAYAEAVAKGGYVIYSAITLDMRKRGMFLAAVAGKTTVEIYYPNARPQRAKYGNATLSVERRLELALNVLKSRLVSEKNEYVREKLRRQISEINSALAMIRNGKWVPYNIKNLVSFYA